MATVVKRPYGFQLRISHKLLPKNLWATFDTRKAAEQYAGSSRGCLPREWFRWHCSNGDQPRQEIWTVHRCIAEYLRHNPVSLSEQKRLNAVMPSVESAHGFTEL
jgi:hypothetical protein